MRSTTVWIHTHAKIPPHFSVQFNQRINLFILSPVNLNKMFHGHFHVVVFILKLVYLNIQFLNALKV